MSDKSKRFEADLDRLIDQSVLLHDALQREFLRPEFDKMIASQFTKEDGKKYVENLPDFALKYQAWYSEALAFVKQTLPDRLKDFISYYEYSRVRKELNFENYRIRDYLQGAVTTRVSGPHKKVIVDGSPALLAFRQQRAIVEAAKSTLSSSLVDLTTILQADLFESEIDSAEALAKAGHLRGAGAVCGVVIEKHLGQVCKNHSIPIRKKKPTINDFNQPLKDNNVITVPQWRLIQHLADIRNICDHNTGREPKREEVDDLVAGTRKILTSIF